MWKYCGKTWNIKSTTSDDTLKREWKYVEKENENWSGRCEVTSLYFRSNTRNSSPCAWFFTHSPHSTGGKFKTLVKHFSPSFLRHSKVFEMRSKFVESSAGVDSIVTFRHNFHGYLRLKIEIFDIFIDERFIVQSPNENWCWIRFNFTF